MSNNSNKGRLLVLLLLLVGALSCKKSETMKAEIAQPTRRTTPFYTQSRSKVLLQNTLPIMQDARSRNVDQLEAEAAIVIPSDQVDSLTASNIFNDVLSQGENLWGKYFVDGQFAYAQNIRRYVENKYHLACYKLFLYGELTGVSPRYGCSASWQYDVACVLRGKGDVVYVLDPRLFSHMVTQETWISSHLVPTSSVAHPRLTSTSHLLGGASFTPLDNIPSGYLVDTKNYVLTDAMLAYYADSVGCHCAL